jgi:hypothetical protein
MADTDKAMNVYLNDHLAGAMLGSDLAEQIRAQSEGNALDELMKSLAPQIEEDRQTQWKPSASGCRESCSLWTALREVADRYELASVKLDEMIERAETQYSALEQERRAAGRRALGSAVEV